MTTRIITGTIYHPVGGAPWAAVDIQFRLHSFFSGGAYTYPTELYTVTTAVDGTFTTSVAVPVSGTVQYECILPDGSQFIFSIDAGAPVALGDLVAIVSAPPGATVALQVLIDAHAAIKSTAIVSGHIDYSAADITTLISTDLVPVARPGVNTAYIASLAEFMNYFTAGLGPVFGFDWCVDSVNGKDSYSGTSPLRPLKTIAALLTKTITADQKIGFATGSHWREQLTVPCVGLTIDAYGIGATPILDASDVIPVFTKTGGQTNVYQASLTTVGDYTNGWEDDISLVRATSIANCDATPGSHYPSAESGAITWYIHTSDSANPNTNGKIYEVSTRGYGVYSDYAVTISNIRTQKQQSTSGSIYVSRSSVLTNVKAYYGSVHNVYIKDGCTLTGVEARYRYHHTSTAALFVFNENTPTGLGITFTNCIADNTGDLSPGGAVADGWYGHVNVSGNYGTVNWIGCSAINCFIGYGGIDHTAALNNCTSLGCTYGIGGKVNTTLTNCALSATQFCISFGVANVSITVVGGSLTVPTVVSNYRPVVYIGAGATDCHISLSGVTISNSGNNNPICVQTYSTGTVINMQTCIFSQAMTPIWIDGAVAATITSDYNTFEAVSSWYWNPNWHTFAQWQALGYDAHSTHV